MGLGAAVIGVGAGRGIPAGPGIGCGTPAGGRAGCTGENAPVGEGLATGWAAIGWLGRGTDETGAG